MLLRKSAQPGVVSALFFLASCTGSLLAPQQVARNVKGSENLATIASVDGVRRLSREEFAATLRQLFGDDTPIQQDSLPIDDYRPYDNNASSLTVSSSYLGLLEFAAEDLATWLTHDAQTMTRVIGTCVASSTSDETCLVHFLNVSAPRILRRMLTDAEREELLTLSRLPIADPAVGDDNASAAGRLRLVIRALLMHPEFILRVEVGEATSGTSFQLSDTEIASKIAFWLTGRTPDDTLLSAAISGELHTPEQLSHHASRLLRSSQGIEQTQRFHSMWLGYGLLPEVTSLDRAMRQETNALIARATSNNADYALLLLSTESFLTPELAAHYGLAVSLPPTGAFIDYGTTQRRGIISHATFLSSGRNATDTSPTRRGKFIRERLLCQPIPPPPPNVNADVPPVALDGTRCKVDRYAAHRDNPSCSSCHSLMDPVGFGLENYDSQGRFRAVETQAPECVIAGAGEVSGVGTFSGPYELAERIMSAGGFEACVVKQTLQYAMGRPLGGADTGFINELTASFKQSGRRYEQLVDAMVRSPLFTQRLAQSE